jgi:hypothetical protein
MTRGGNDVQYNMGSMCGGCWINGWGILDQCGVGLDPCAWGGGAGNVRGMSDQCLGDVGSMCGGIIMCTQ